MYRVSVVVPTYQRPDLLNSCLSALITQDFDPSAYEVIVVDDAASEETRRQVECWAERLLSCGHAIRYLAVAGRHGPAAARNVGWRAARAEIITFTDDDCLPSPRWLRAGVNAFKDRVEGVSGKIHVPLSCTPTDYERDAAHLETSQFVTANCFYRRSALAQVGGFDERFTMAWREDSDLFFSLLECGTKLVCVPEALVVHPLRPAPWGVSLKQQRKSMFNALLYKKHPALYRQKIQTAPPWHYYSIVAALLLTLSCCMKKLYKCAFVSFCVWLLLTGRFCMQRLHMTSHAPFHIAEMIVTSIFIPPLAIFWRIRGAIKFRVFFL